MTVPSSRVSFDCDPCIDRANVKVKVILHGNAKAGFWKLISSAITQVSTELGIHADIQFYNNDYNAMTDEIIKASEDDSLNALIVSIPNTEIQVAVQTAIKSGLPILGINSGGDLDIPGLLGHVGMDERHGGSMAAESFISAWFNSGSEAHNSTSRRVLYINHEQGNKALHQRFLGLSEIRNLTTISVTLDELVVDVRDDSLQNRLNQALKSCPYDGVMLASEALLDAVTSAYYQNRCDFKTQILGSFDTTLQIYNSIAVSKLSFAVSQQPYLQGSLPIALAGLYATTGQSLVTHSAMPLMTGPQIITLQNLPPDTRQMCEAEGFQICRDGIQTNGRCDCLDRSRVRIGGVITDDPTKSKFWALIWEAARQGASDMGVQLVMDRIERADTFSIESLKTGEKVKSLCREGVDGVFTTIKSEEVYEAIQYCQELEVPVISINSGLAFAEMLNLTQHISMNEYAAGYTSGKSLLEAGMKYGYCVNWHIVNDLSPRCEGFADAISDANSNAIYIGVLAAPHDNIPIFQQVLEANITQGGETWNEVGILLVSAPFVPAGLRTKEAHRDVLLACMDVDPVVNKALDDWLLVSTIDQQPYLQGYLPVLLLTWMSQTQQHLLNMHLETGPILVRASPSEAEKVCDANLFTVCPAPFNKNHLAAYRPIGLTFVVSIVCTAIAFVAWVQWNKNARIVTVSQPIFLVTLCVGTIVMASAIIPLSLDDGVLAAEGGCVGCTCDACDIACMSSAWLFTMGFTIMFASLFSKIWRVNRLIGNSNRFRRLVLSAKDVMIPFVVLLALNVAFMTIWTIVDPMYWDRTRKCGSDDFTSYGMCRKGKGSVSTAMTYSVSAVNFCALLMANYQAFQARNFSTEFSESRYIGFAMMSILQVSVVGLPIIFLVEENPSARFIVSSGIIAAICFSVLLLIFVPKILLLRKSRGPSATTAAQVEEESTRRRSVRRTSAVAELVSSSRFFVRQRRNSFPSDHNDSEESSSEPK